MTIQKLGVVGLGQMGQGIAQIAAQAGLDVVMVDADAEFARRALAKLTTTLGKLVDKGKLTAEQRDQAVARLRTAPSLRDLEDRDFVIEAAPEREALKLQIFDDLGQYCRAAAILASNTSSISITKIAAASHRPEQVIGMHFMNPVPLMKLVEIVRGLPTSDHTYQTTVDLAQRFGKTTIGARDIPGFIDTGVKLGLNHPMGPLELSDLIGLDTCLAIAEVLHRELGDDKYRPCPLLRQYVAAGWLGKKVGRGFYTYDKA